MNVLTNTELLSVKELAAKLGRSERYVWWMRDKGYEMIAGRGTLASALEFLKNNPTPCKRSKVMNHRAIS